MPDADAILLRRDAGNDFAIERKAVRLAAEPRLSLAKLQILAADPDAWFETVLGVKAPDAQSEMELDAVACAWLAPGEWLLTGPGEEVERIRGRCAEAAGGLGLMVDVTHGRASYELSGSEARSVLAAHCPLDLCDVAMPVGAAKRSLFSETGFFISRRPDRQGQPCFRLIFDQTMSGYAERMLGATISGNNK